MISAKSDVQVDTPEVRVTEWRLAPGSATGHHIHEMDYVIVPVTAGEMTIVAPNGERSKAQLGVGKSYFRKAGVEHVAGREGVDRLHAEVVVAAARQRVRLVDQQHPAERGLQCLRGLQRGLADETGETMQIV